MSEQLKESLSAAMDDEADAFELRRVLDEAGAKDSLRDQWHRYHVMRQVIRQESVTVDPSQLRESMWQALHEDPDAISDVEDYPELVVAEQSDEPGSARASIWGGRLIGVGIAAAVAVVVGISGGVFDPVSDAPALAGNSTTLEGAVLPGANIAGNPAGQLDRAQIAPVMYSQATQIDRQRQEAFMMRHIQSRAINQSSVTSFVKMATFRTEQPTTGAARRAALQESNDTP